MNRARNCKMPWKDWQWIYKHRGICCNTVKSNTFLNSRPVGGTQKSLALLYSFWINLCAGRDNARRIKLHLNGKPRILFYFSLAGWYKLAHQIRLAGSCIGLITFAYPQRLNFHIFKCSIIFPCLLPLFKLTLKKFINGRRIQHHVFTILSHYKKFLSIFLLSNSLTLLLPNFLTFSHTLTSSLSHFLSHSHFLTLSSLFFNFLPSYFLVTLSSSLFVHCNARLQLPSTYSVLVQIILICLLNAQRGI